MKGDVLLAIDAQAVEELDGLLEIRELLKQPAGTVLAMSIERDGEEREVRLKLRDLFD
jgi:S1-C subfamily serine protease